MVHTAVRVDWVVVASETEALSLEYTWIKEFSPRFNVRFRDDKSYPYLAITLNEEFPRVTVMRGDRRRGVKYFGPYPHAWAIRETVDLLLRVFPMRSCAPGVFRDAQRTGRACLLGYIDRCAAPCTGRVTPAEHREIVNHFAQYMSGDGQRFIDLLTSEMSQASNAQDYERAARLRDQVNTLVAALERNALVFADRGSFDILGFAFDEVQSAVALFHIRDGRIRGQRGFVVDQVEDVSQAEMIEKLLMQVYGAKSEDLPAEILVPQSPSNLAAMEVLFSELRGSQVRIKVPQRGSKAKFQETADHNAADVLRVQTMKRSTDLTARSEALRQIQEALSLSSTPYRIECIDISNVSGTNIVGSLVVFEDALALKRDYRSYGIRGDYGTDDTASVREVVSRRFTNLTTGLDIPDLLLVDGGQPQVAAAAQALRDLELAVPVAGLAKRLEEVWLPNSNFPLILPRTSEALFLLQRIRDEAHRSAIGFHRKKRSKAMLVSALDAVPGLGPVRRRRLMQTFGDVRRVQAATLDEIAALPGFGMALAEQVRKALDAST